MAAAPVSVTNEEAFFGVSLPPGRLQCMWAGSAVPSCAISYAEHTAGSQKFSLRPAMCTVDRSTQRCHNSSLLLL